MSGLVDTHTHLCDTQFDATVKPCSGARADAGVGRIVEIADNPEEWSRAVSLARAHPDRMRCSARPASHYADRFDAGFVARLKAALAAAPEAIAIGEIGLDYAKAPVSPEVQRLAFAALLEAGRDWGVPLVIHCATPTPT